MESEKIKKKIEAIDSKREKDRIFKKDSSFLKVEENVFDIPTLHLLYDFSKKGYIKELGGSVSTGKEANVFHAVGKESEYAVKIYRISSNTFKAMDPYILKDRRFESVGNNRKKIIFAWAKKEFQNLKRVNKTGIPTPIPVAVSRNVLIMSFLGKNGKPYPHLKDTSMTKKDADEAFKTILDYMKKMYQKAQLIHADLSEYNILIEPKTRTPYIIDIGQSVTLDHPNAYEFLKRDIQNMLRFFRKYEIEIPARDVFAYITEAQEEKI